MKRGIVVSWFFSLLGHWKKILFSVIFCIFVGILNFLVGRYVDGTAFMRLDDPLFKILPSFQIFGPAFVWGIFFSIGILLIYPLFFRVRDFAYTFGQLGLLVFVRNFFVLLCGLKSPAGAVAVTYPGFINYWNFNNDLFFSGHVAVPLLGFFIFKDSKMRYFFLADAIIMALLALVTHKHYSVDILGGIFIGYSSYKFGEWLFSKRLR